MKLSHLVLNARRVLFTAAAVLLISLSFTPITFADSATDCTVPSPSTPGVHVPTGSDAAMFQYDCTQSLWISAHYIYNPQTDIVSSLDSTVYAYNTTTSQWDYDTWVYVASKGDYALRTFSVSTPPAGATTVGGPITADTPSITLDQTSATNSNGGVMTLANTSGTSATAIAVANSVGSIAASGDATVAMNTTGGGASSGDATAIATLVNMLQSSGNVFGSTGNAVVFSTTINGDVTGDILLDPSLIGSIQPSSTPPSALSDVNGIAQSTSTASVTNNLALGAATGNALVAANTTAGDAMSGNATAVANVLNFLNSTVVGGKSFLGIININGNLNGDILLPPNFIDELLASNVPTVSIAVPFGTNGALNTSVSQSITNAVSATAATGNATVDKNTSAGNATTGNGTTNVTTFNLTGNTVIGKNALLVFVNSMGTWYGLIFNAPAGATAATLGGDITTAATATPQTISQYATNQTIDNNIIATAQSGNATVTKNTTAGNAKTGDAKVAVNVLNIANSALSLSNWFGVLFINVFGSWTGSFGIDTIAGTVGPVTPPTSTGGGSSTSDTRSTLFSFVPKEVASTTIFHNSSSNASEPVTDLSGGSVLAAQHFSPTSKNGSGDRQSQKSVVWIYVLLILVWLLLIAGEQIYTKLRKHS